MSGDVARKGPGDGRHAVILGSLALAVVVVAIMVRGHHGVDPWTTALVVPLSTAAAAGGHLRSLRRPCPSLHDEVDRETGVGNARAVLSLLDRELDRAGSWGSVFSVAVVEIEHGVFTETPARRARRTLATLFRGVVRDVRLDDHVCRVSTADRELVVVLLPDTGTEGCRRFTSRLSRHTHEHLGADGLVTAGRVGATTMTFPGDGEEVARFQRRMQVLAETEDLLGDVAVAARGPRSVAPARPDHLRVVEAVEARQG